MRSADYVSSESDIYVFLESGPVEVLTFLLLWVGVVQGFALARRCSDAHDRVTALFYFAFSAGLFFVAMEEIAWGQKLLGFKTPAFIASHNYQGELTLHNLAMFQKHASDGLQLTFGLGGIAGVLLGRYRAFRKIGAPVVLAPWFGVIIVQATLDWWNNDRMLQHHLDWLVRQLVEVSELVIAGAACAYVWLNARMLRREAGV
jgi:hypothetical protein